MKIGWKNRQNIINPSYVYHNFFMLLLNLNDTFNHCEIFINDLLVLLLKYIKNKYFTLLDFMVIHLNLPIYHILYIPPPHHILA